MSPTPEQIRPGSERNVFLLRTGRIVREAVETYLRLYRAERIRDWRVVGLVIESGDRELIHPLLLCKVDLAGMKSLLQLRVLGGFPERPSLAVAGENRGEERLLSVRWGPQLGERRYQSATWEFLRAEPKGNYFYLPNSNGLGWDEAKNLRVIVPYASGRDCGRLLDGIRRAMGD